MREYEVMVITDQEVSDQDYSNYQNKWEETLFGSSEHLIQKLDWGVRSLTTPIRKKTQGRYLVYEFASEPDQIEKFEKMIQYDRNVLRHLVLQKGFQVDVEKRKAEIVEKAKKQEERHKKDDRSESVSSGAIEARRQSALKHETQS